MGHVVGQEFQRDVTTEVFVFRFIHYAHSTTAQFFKHAVM